MVTATTTRHGYCLKCQARCGVLAEVTDGRLTAIRRDDAHPNGGICAMGAAAPEVAASPKRLTRPLRRTNGKDEPPLWAEVSWEEALDELVARLQQTKAQYGPEAVAFSRPTTSANGSADWFPYLVRLANLFGTPNVHTTSYLCQWNRDNGLADSYGVGLPTPQVDRSDVAIVFGHNPAITNPHMRRDLQHARSRGATVIVVDPRKSETTKFADLWLSPRYGTDGALVLGAARELIASGRFDVDFVTDWTNAPFLVDAETGRFVRGDPRGGHAGEFAVAAPGGGIAFVDPTTPPASWPLRPVLDAQRSADDCRHEAVAERPRRGALTGFRLLRDRVEPYTLDRVTQATGLDAQAVQAFAEHVAPPGSLSYYTWNGWEQHTNSYYTHRSMAVLYALTGSFDAPGGNVIYPPMELVDVEGRAHLSAEQTAKRLGTNERPLGAPTYSSAAYFFYNAILDEQPYPLRTLVSFGSNMLLQNPDSDRGRDALRALDFHAHIDMFHTPMTESADLVLPAATQWESPGLRMGFEGPGETAFHVQYRAPTVSPPGQARSDLEVIFEFADRLGFADSFWGADVGRAFEARLAPHGLTLEDLRASPRGVTLDKEIEYRKYARVDAATGAVEGFATPTSKLEVYSEKLLDHGYEPLPVYIAPSTTPPENPAIAEQYPLVLSSIKLPAIAHSQHRGIPSLRKRWRHPFVDVHPRTAAAHRVTDGDIVRVETPHGAMTVPVRTSERVREGAVVGQAGWWEDCPELDLPGYNPFVDHGANYNRLVPTTATDEVSGGVPVKSYHCRLVHVADGS